MYVFSYPGPIEGDRSGECDGVGDSQEALVGLLLDVAPRALPLQGPFRLACREILLHVGDTLSSNSISELNFRVVLLGVVSTWPWCNVILYP